MKATSREHLQQLIAQEMAKGGTHVDLNHIDVSGIAQMQGLFYHDCIIDGQRMDLRQFSGDISRWDVSNVTSMATMFRESHFEGDLSLWDVQRVKSMRAMFFNSHAKVIASTWKTSSLVEGASMFENAAHIPDVSDWDTSSLVDAYGMFSRTHADIDVSCWDVSKLNSASCMFYISAFNGDVSNWDTQSLSMAVGMFAESKFSGDVSRWKTHRLTQTQRMFSNSPFNGDVSQWDVGAVDGFQGMFLKASFSGDLSRWNIKHNAHVRDMVGTTSCATLPPHWPLAKVKDVFPTVAGSNAWLRNSKSKGLAAWQAVQGKTKPSWWTKEEYQNVVFARDTLVQLGVPLQEAVVQSWQQWHDATHRPVQDMGSSFDFASILAS